MNAISKISLITGWLPPTLFAITGVVIVVLVLLNMKKFTVRGSVTALLVAVVSAALGRFLVWLICDKLFLFGVTLGWEVELVITIAICLLSLVIFSLIRSKGARRAISIILIPLIILSAALRVDIIFGEYTTLGALFGKEAYATLDLSVTGKAKTTVAQWKQLAEKDALPDMPKQGIIRSVRIPATISGFRARTADVYLPPAALSDNPPALPVMVMLAGQPGSPDRFFSASQFATQLNAFAASHNGLAPIVVSPDQNGSSIHNSLCADTDIYGNAETYLTKDVTNWITSNLPVATAPNQWLIGGFSQGGTCSTQLGPAHPNIYGHIFSVGGELEPTDLNKAHTIQRDFNGDEKAFMEHVPAEIIAKNAPSTQTWFSAAGAWDKESQTNQMTNSTAAKNAGMSVTAIIAQDSGHDWHSVQTALAPELNMFCAQTGLGTTNKSVADYPKVKIVDIP